VSDSDHGEEEEEEEEEKKKKKVSYRHYSSHYRS